MNGNVSLGGNLLVGRGIATGSTNIAIGNNALNALTSGTSNTIVGTSANSTGNPTNCTIIGADATCASYTKSTAIGKDATATASNQVVLGTATESVIIPRNIRYLSSPMVAYSFTTTTQSISNMSNTIINFPVADTRNGAYSGLTYSAGTFTNSNSYSVTLNVSVCASFASNSTGYRVIYISAPGVLNIISITDTSATNGDATCVSTSATFVLNAGETFNAKVFQNSGGALNIGWVSDLSTRISILVL
jgi:hypothetical protein